VNTAREEETKGPLATDLQVDMKQIAEGKEGEKSVGGTRP